MSSVCPTHLLEIFSSRNPFLSTMRRIFYSIFLKPTQHRELSSRIFRNNYKHLFTYSTTRKNHKKLIESYVKFLNNKKKSLVFCLLEGRNEINFNYNAFFESLLFIKKKKLFSWDLNFIFIFSTILHTMIHKIEIEKNFNNGLLLKTYVSLNSAWGIENIYTHYLKYHKILTFNLQHAIFNNYSHLKNIEINNFSNIPSKYFLTWGQYSIDQVKMFVPPNIKLKCIGNPIVQKQFKKKYPNKINQKILLIALPRNDYNNEIRYLFKILNSSLVIQSYNLKIRPHPSISRQDLSLLLPQNSNLKISFDDELTIFNSISKYKPKAIITFNSSIFFELINFSEKLHVFQSPKNDFYLKSANNFSHVNELITNIKKPNKIKNLSYFIGDKKIKEIKKIFNNSF